MTPPRLELGTPSLKVRCSNQLSYEVNFVVDMGLEPTQGNHSDFTPSGLGNQPLITQSTNLDDKVGFEPTDSRQFPTECFANKTSYHLTPLHQVNGLAAIWEWGFPVNSGLRDVVGIEPTR